MACYRLESWPIFFILFIALTLCGQVKAQYPADAIDADLTRKAHAVVRVDDSKLYIQREEYKLEHKQVITVLSKKGEDYLTFIKGYKEGSSKISDIELLIYDKDGKQITKIKSKDIEDYASTDGFSIISDYRIKHYRYETSDYPVTIEMSYTLHSDNTYSLPFWRPLPGYNVSIEQSSYTVVNESDVKIATKEMNLEGMNIIKNENSYILSGQPVRFYERYGPTPMHVFPKVLIKSNVNSYEGHTGYYEDWDGFGRWMYGSFLADKYDLQESRVQKELDALLTGVSDDRSRAKIIYDFVQENTRYISIGLDEGGLEPLSAGKVHEVKYGDCKALSFYMKSLLALYNIEANYVAVHAGGDDPDDMLPDFPSVYPGNHAIINIPMDQDTVWLDCTSHDNPFDFLGSFTDDRVALQITPDGGQLVRTPRYTEDQNKIDYRGKMDITKDGDVSVDLSIVRTGLAIEGGMGIQRYDDKELDEFIKTQLLEDFDQLADISHDYNFIEDELSFTEEYSFTAKGYAEKAGDYLLLPMKFMDIRIPRLKKDSNREQPIVFHRGYTRSYELVCTVPVGFRSNIPDDFILDNKYGKYTQQVAETAPNTYMVSREFVLHKGTYDPSEYKEIKLTFDKILKQEQAMFSLSNKS